MTNLISSLISMGQLKFFPNDTKLLSLFSNSYSLQKYWVSGNNLVDFPNLFDTGNDTVIFYLKVLIVSSLKINGLVI